MSIFRCGECQQIFDLSQQSSLDLGMNYCQRCFHTVKSRIESYNKRINDAIISSRSSCYTDIEPFEKDEPPEKGKKKQPKQKYNNGTNGRGR